MLINQFFLAVGYLVKTVLVRMLCEFFSIYLNKSVCLKSGSPLQNLTTPCFVVCLFCFCFKESLTITPTRWYVSIKEDIDQHLPPPPSPLPPIRNTPVVDSLIYQLREEFDISGPWGIWHHMGRIMGHLVNKLLQSRGEARRHWENSKGQPCSFLSFWLSKKSPSSDVDEKYILSLICLWNCTPQYGYVTVVEVQ